MNELLLKARLIYKSLPPRFSPAQLAAAYEKGMLRKEELEDGGLYHGTCRNASIARWDATRQRFVYQRTKFGTTFPEDIVHPEDDEGFDVFVPVQKAADVSI